jgi:hypothetical protein
MDLSPGRQNRVWGSRLRTTKTPPVPSSHQTSPPRRAKTASVWRKLPDVLMAREKKRPPPPAISYYINPPIPRVTPRADLRNLYSYPLFPTSVIFFAPLAHARVRDIKPSSHQKIISLILIYILSSLIYLVTFDVLCWLLMACASSITLFAFVSSIASPPPFFFIYPPIFEGDLKPQNQEPLAHAV